MYRSLSSPLGTVLVGSAAAVLAFTAVRSTAVPAGQSATTRARHAVTARAEQAVGSAAPARAPQAVAAVGSGAPTPTDLPPGVGAVAGAAVPVAASAPAGSRRPAVAVTAHPRRPTSGRTVVARGTLRVAAPLTAGPGTAVARSPLPGAVTGTGPEPTPRRSGEGPGARDVREQGPE